MDDTRRWNGAMWINVVQILLGGCCLLTTGQTYTFNEAATDWSSAGNVCSLATPIIRYSSVYGESFSFPIDSESLPNITGKNVWVGYFASNHVFQYEGCVTESDVRKRHVTSYRVGNRPGACFSACNRTKLFGMLYKDHHDGDHNCFCYDYNLHTNLYQTKCTMKCAQPRVACGNYHFISLYSEVKTNTSIQTYPAHPGDCVSYVPDVTSGDWYWTLCDLGIHVLCENGDQLWNHYKFSEWLATSKYCFYNNRRPARVLNDTLSTYNNIRDINRHYRYWTGLFRDLVIHTTDEMGVVSPEQYGYLATAGHSVYLRFTPVISKHYTILCSAGANAKSDPMVTTASAVSISTSHTDSRLTNNPNDSDDNGANAKSDPMVTTASAISMSTSHTDSRFTKNPNDSDDNVPMIAGTISGSVGLIIFVVVGGILYKRDCWKCICPSPPSRPPTHDLERHCHCNRATTMNKDGRQGDADNATNAGICDYQDVGLTNEATVPNNDPNYSYAKVQKKENTSNSHSKDKRKVAQVYNIVAPPDEDTYDHTNDKNTVAQHGSADNHYNALAMEQDTDTYDHTGAKSPTDKSTDNVYNTADTDVDVTPYDVIGEKTARKVMCDNVYNTTQEQQDNGDVYDKTNDDCLTKHIADNVYDKACYGHEENMYETANDDTVTAHMPDNMYDKARYGHEENMYETANDDTVTTHIADNVYDKARYGHENNVYETANDDTVTTHIPDNMYYKAR